MVTKWDYLEIEGLEAPLWLNEKSKIESVAEGWLTILCCWEAAVYTHD